MSTFQNFEEIQAWQEGRILVKAIREICKRSNVKKDFSFCDQITRSARSISANIAEGSEALTVPNFINYLGHAKKSAGEVRSHLYDAIDENYITREEFEKLAEQTKYICRMIAKLIHYLQTQDQKRKRTISSSTSN